MQYKPASIYLGQDKASGKVVGYNYAGHLLTVGPTRSGKSRRLLIPNLLGSTGTSTLVVDIKGELAAHTAAQRVAKGGQVVALDPFGELPKRGVKVPRVGFNPMLALDPKSDDFVDDAMLIAESLVQVTPEMKEPHFAESAQDLVAALVMLVRCFYGDKATLGMVRRELANSPAEIERIAIQSLLTPKHDAITAKLSKFRGSKESREIPSIISTAQTQTRFLDSPAMVSSLAAGGVDFEALKTSKLTVYLVLPPERLVTHAKWLRLIITAAMRSMQKPLANDRGEEVLFMLDEFPQLGRLQSVETAVALNAGYGVKVWAAVQNLGQLKQQYGENWETFAAAGVLTAYAPRDVFTREYLTNLIGQRTITTEGVTYSHSGDVSVNRSPQKDIGMRPDEWRAFVAGESLAFIPRPTGQVIMRLTCPDFTELVK